VFSLTPVNSAALGGRLADFVELSADPWTVDPAALIETVQVTGTWLGGRRIDLDEFLASVGGTDNSEHAHLAERTAKGCC
jgi:hypothetical protein